MKVNANEVFPDQVVLIYYGFHFRLAYPSTLLLDIVILVHSLFF